MLGRQTGRKALVVFTDGEDQGSHATINDVERRLQSSDVTLYMIGQGRGVTVEPLKRIMERLVGADRRPRAVHRQHRRAARRVRPICSTSCRTSTCSATSPPTQARRRVARDQGRSRRSSRRARAPGLPGDRSRNERPDRWWSRVVVRHLAASRRRGRRCSRSSRRPAFSSSVEVTSVDVSVVDDRGQPVDRSPAGGLHRPRGRLAPARRERAMGAVVHAGRGRACGVAADGYTSNEATTGGRLIVLAIDQPNIPLRRQCAARQDARRLHRSSRAVGPDFGGRLRRRGRHRAVHERPRAGEARARAHHGRGPRLRRNFDAQPVAGGVAADRQRQHRGASTKSSAANAPAFPACSSPRLPEQHAAAKRRGIVQLAKRGQRPDDCRRCGRCSTSLTKVDAPKTVILVSQMLPMVDQELDLARGRGAGGVRAREHLRDSARRAGGSVHGPAPRRRRASSDRMLTTAGLDAARTASPRRAPSRRRRRPHAASIASRPSCPATTCLASSPRPATRTARRIRWP